MFDIFLSILSNFVLIYICHIFMNKITLHCNIVNLKKIYLQIYLLKVSLLLFVCIGWSLILNEQSTNYNSWYINISDTILHLKSFSKYQLDTAKKVFKSEQILIKCHVYMKLIQFVHKYMAPLFDSFLGWFQDLLYCK